MDHTFTSNIVILLILTLSIISKNSSLSISIAFLLLINLIGQMGGPFGIISEKILKNTERYGLEIGLIILMIGILSPLAMGKIDVYEILQLIKSRVGIITIISGILVAIFASHGGKLLINDPKVISTLILGIIVGVVFFKGYPVGPLIASGIAVILLKITDLLVK